MSGKLSDFLLELGKHPAKVKALRASPDKVMSDAGLADEEKEIVKSGDPARIRAAISGVQLADNVIVVVVLAV